MSAGLRTRFFAVFAGFAVVVTAMAGWIATDLIGRAAIQEAEAALRLNLQAAQGAVDGLAEEWSLLTAVLGGGRRVARGLAEPTSPSAIAELEGIRREVGLDLFALTDRAGWVVLRAAPPYAAGDRLAEDIVSRALAGEIGAGFVRLSGDRILRENDELAGRLGLGDGVSPDRAELAMVVAAPAHDQFQIAQVFDRFRRFVDGEPGAPRGSGLGLFVAREIVRMHGGGITVESAAGRWIRFVVHIPDPPADQQRADRDELD